MFPTYQQLHAAMHSCKGICSKIIFGVLCDIDLLEKEWSSVALQTGWKLEPLICFEGALTYGPALAHPPNPNILMAADESSIPTPIPPVLTNPPSPLQPPQSQPNPPLPPAAPLLLPFMVLVKLALSSQKLPPAPARLLPVRVLTKLSLPWQTPHQT